MTQDEIEGMARELVSWSCDPCKVIELRSCGCMAIAVTMLRRAYNAGLDTADACLNQGTPGLREPASLRALKLPE